MSGSLNKAMIIGNLGKDPVIHPFQNGSRVANLSVATSETWKNQQGERQERTTWHRVNVLNDGLVTVCENYLSKGSKIYIEGQIETRKWTDQRGNDKYATEIVLRPYKSELVILDNKNQGQGQSQGQSQRQQVQESYAPSASDQRAAAPVEDDLEDEIPFAWVMPLAASVLSMFFATGAV